MRTICSSPTNGAWYNPCTLSLTHSLTVTFYITVVVTIFSPHSTTILLQLNKLSHFNTIPLMTQKPKQTTTQPVADEISSSIKLRINMSRNIMVLTVMIKGGIYYCNLFKTINIRFKTSTYMYTYTR